MAIRHEINVNKILLICFHFRVFTLRAMYWFNGTQRDVCMED
jgi:hypothetical protein